MRQPSTDPHRLRAKLIRSLAIVAVILGAFAHAKDYEFDMGTDGAVTPATAAAARTSSGPGAAKLIAAGISCSLDSAYGADFLWTRTFTNAIVTVDSDGAPSLALFDEGESWTPCEREGNARVTGSVSVEGAPNSEGSQFIVRTSGMGVGQVQLTVRELIARVLAASELASIR